MRTFMFLLAAAGLAAPNGHAEETQTVDIVVCGGTPAGIAAAVSAARSGRSVALIEYHPHVGAMSSSGLGKSDIVNRAVIQGFFREFVDQIRNHYAGAGNADDIKLCRDGYYYEPSVAERVFEYFLAKEPAVRVYRNHRLESVDANSNRLTGVTVVDRKNAVKRSFRAKVFIDATYEGDLYAAAGAGFRVGREARDEFGEPHAGEIYLDFRDHQIFGGSGKGDSRIQPYTYRLCFSTDSANQAPLTEPPAGYRRERYLGYLDDAASGRFGSKTSATNVAFSIAPIPGEKTDTNMNPRGLGFVFVEENYGYIEANWAKREQIAAHVRNLTLGLLWFLQNDSEVPSAARDKARKYHLARDEFADNGNFPFQFYVREARRLKGEYTLSERNITEQPGLDCQRRHPDAIAVGEFPIDSFPMRKRQPGDERVLEGYLCMLEKITRPYHIPYRIMIPQQLDGVIVPVAASTTHVAFSSIRMEPTWMAMGQAAGIAASLAIETRVEPRKVDVGKLQERLRGAGAVVDF